MTFVNVLYFSAIWRYVTVPFYAAVYVYSSTLERENLS